MATNRLHDLAESFTGAVSDLELISIEIAKTQAQLDDLFRHRNKVEGIRQKIAAEIKDYLESISPSSKNQATIVIEQGEDWKCGFGVAARDSHIGNVQYRDAAVGARDAACSTNASSAQTRDAAASARNAAENARNNAVG